VSADSNFDYCIPIVLEFEGGLVDNPHDPGGTTNMGISQRAYPHTDIRALTKPEAEQIYYNDYWLKNSCGEVPVHLNLWYFNACVMSGGVTAAKILQQVVGSPTDGVMGPHTLAAVKAFPSSGYVEYLTLYTGHLMSLPGFKTFGKGWMNRLFRIAAL